MIKENLKAFYLSMKVILKTFFGYVLVLPVAFVLLNIGNIIRTIGKLVVFIGDIFMFEITCFFLFKDRLYEIYKDFKSFYC